ncbi:MAG: 8-amino-7-oxononanoate synthase [Bacteroidales bacterium]
MLMNYLEEKLTQKKENGNYRVLLNIDDIREEALLRTGDFINLSANDYLGLAENKSLRKEFLETLNEANFRPSSSSSRLLTGNTLEYQLFEEELASAFNAESALLFSCGYHANTGIIPAIADHETLILADKLIHASMIDGIKLSDAKCIRFRHLDYVQLGRLVKEHHSAYRSILIVTESIFSMDGDETDLQRLVELKKRYPKVALYIDEAHSFGVRGNRGLGCCEEQNCIEDIDYIVGTFGKALASIGAFLISNRTAREYLINSVRPFIFTTALPPVNIAWTRFLFHKLPEFNQERSHLRNLSAMLHDFIATTTQPPISTSHIIPIMIGENKKAIHTAIELQKQGFYILPIRPPAVPVGTARLRISLSAEHTNKQMLDLIKQLKQLI